ADRTGPREAAIQLRPAASRAGPGAGEVRRVRSRPAAVDREDARRAEGAGRAGAGETGLRARRAAAPAPAGAETDARRRADDAAVEAGELRLGPAERQE